MSFLHAKCLHISKEVNQIKKNSINKMSCKSIHFGFILFFDKDSKNRDFSF